MAAKTSYYDKPKIYLQVHNDIGNNTKYKEPAEYCQIVALLHTRSMLIMKKIIFSKGYQVAQKFLLAAVDTQHTSICHFDNRVTMYICYSIRTSYSICSVCLSLPRSRQRFTVSIISLWFQSSFPCFIMTDATKSQSNISWWIKPSLTCCIFLIFFKLIW